LIINGLSNLDMKPTESTGELLARITNTMLIIKGSYATYENKIKATQHEANRGYLDATATKWKNNFVKNVMQFFKMQLFRAALPGDICMVETQHDQNSITLDNMYRSQPTPREKADPNSQKLSPPSTRRATLTPRMMKMRLQPFRTGGTRDSPTKPRSQTQCNLAIDDKTCAGNN